jgi:hypothetical protein
VVATAAAAVVDAVEEEAVAVLVAARATVAAGPALGTYCQSSPFDHR